MYPVINFEGIDGAGKSFALDHLRKYYVDKGIPVKVVESISQTEFKNALDPKWYDMSNPSVRFMEYLTYEINNYYKNIVPSLGQSVILIDRYFPSCFAYNRLLPLDQTYQAPFFNVLNELVTRFYIPDVTFIFDAPDDVIKYRFENFRKYEKAPNPKFDAQVREGYDHFEKSYNYKWNIVKINGARPINEIVDTMTKEIDALKIGATI